MKLNVWKGVMVKVWLTFEYVCIVLQKEMLETVLAFRSFMSRSDIHWYDIHHVLCTNQCSDNNGLDEKNPISSLIGQLLMVFITHSVSGATLAQEVMKKVIYNLRDHWLTGYGGFLSVYTVWTLHISPEPSLDFPANSLHVKWKFSELSHENI